MRSYSGYVHFNTVCHLQVYSNNVRIATIIIMPLINGVAKVNPNDDILRLFCVAVGARDLDHLASTFPAGPNLGHPMCHRKKIRIRPGLVAYTPTYPGSCNFYA